MKRRPLLLLAVAATPTGRRMEKPPVLLDHWFDWKAYHPDAGVYLLGER